MGGEYVGVTPRAESPGHTTPVRLAIMTLGHLFKEKERVQKSGQESPRGDHFYSKRLNSFLFPGSYLDFVSSTCKTLCGYLIVQYLR